MNAGVLMNSHIERTHMEIRGLIRMLHNINYAFYITVLLSVPLTLPNFTLCKIQHLLR